MQKRLLEKLNNFKAWNVKILRFYLFKGERKMIKMIAVDMDGTFLDDKKEYDKALFTEQLGLLKKLGISFVVASGNQYLHLKRYFPEFLSEISFICENGALIVEKNQFAYERFIHPIVVKTIIETLISNKELIVDRMILSGKRGSYLLKNTKDEFIKSGRFFYHNLHLVDSLLDVTDNIYKITLNFPADKKAEGRSFLQNAFHDQVKILTSGVKAIDIISNEAGKEVGLEVLQEQLEISNDELACFGDNLNDLGMIKKAKYGFVMENGKAELKKHAYKVIGNNNQNAVLREINEIILEQSLDNFQD